MNVCASGQMLQLQSLGRGTRDDPVMDLQVLQLGNGRFMRSTQVLAFTIAGIVYVKIADLNRLDSNVIVPAIDPDTGETVLGLKSF
jgi:hypothetical protein